MSGSRKRGRKSRDKTPVASRTAASSSNVLQYTLAFLVALLASLAAMIHMRTTTAAEDTWGPGDLNQMFERIIENKEDYKAMVLSRPSHPSVSDEADYGIGPWVITLEDFLSPEECQRLIAIGEAQGYAVSKTFQEKEVTATQRRTSEGTWCRNECSKDPVARSVMDTIANLTGIPETNQERMQLLRYQVGQYYKTHHDYLVRDKTRRCGVRLITVYLYLNDVEEGGGTDFPHLGITVMPKTGRALIWPSVQDADPNEKDSRTDHQALPVERGLKYGANVWIHMRDYKGA